MLNIVKSVGILDDLMFTILVLMAIITTASALVLRQPGACRSLSFSRLTRALAVAGPCLSIFFTSKRILAETQAELKAKARAKGACHTQTALFISFLTLALPGPPVVRPSPGAPPQRAARLVVLVHDVARGERLLEAAVSTLLPGSAFIF